MKTFVYAVIFNTDGIIGVPVGIFQTRKAALEYRNQFRKDNRRGLKVYKYLLNPDYNLTPHGYVKQV